MATILLTVASTTDNLRANCGGAWTAGPGGHDPTPEPDRADGLFGAELLRSLPQQGGGASHREAGVLYGQPTRWVRRPC